MLDLQSVGKVLHDGRQTGESEDGDEGKRQLLEREEERITLPHNHLTI